MRNRAGSIRIEENKFALLESDCHERHYLVFSGGGIDKGERAQQAAIRQDAKKN